MELIYRPFLFFQKSGIFSGIWESLIVLLAKSTVENPFQVLWSAKRTDKKKLFSQYYLPCHKKLTLYCLSILKDIELAENAATDTMLKLFEKGKQADKIENPERWLFTVAKNRCLSLLSQKKRRREIVDQLKPSMQTTTRSDGARQLEASDLTKKIQSILNEKEWSIWNLHQQGYDNREMASQLQMTEKTVANLKSMARNKLKKAFKK
ncbi:MAG: hypothetical protein Sapg2KO_11020 [Saprospiraceae bacterium]